MARVRARARVWQSSCSACMGIRNQLQPATLALAASPKPSCRLHGHEEADRLVGEPGAAAEGDVRRYREI